MTRKVIGFVVSVLISGCTPLAIPHNTSPLTPTSPLLATIGYFCEKGETRAAWFVENTSKHSLGFQVSLEGEQIYSGNINPGQKYNGNDIRAVGIGEYVVTTDFHQTIIAVLRFNTTTIDCKGL